MSSAHFAFARVLLLLASLPCLLVAASAQAQSGDPTYPWSDDGIPPKRSPPTPWTDAPLPPLDPPPAPRPPEPPSGPFGAAGEVVLGGATNVGLSYTSYDSSAATYFSASFSPNVDYFFLRNVSIGLDINVSYSDEHGYAADSSLIATKQTYVGFGPRFGWNIPLGDHFSWWLTGTLGVQFISTSQSVLNGQGTTVTSPSTSQDGPYVSAYAPLLFHPMPHFFLGVGPSVYHQFGALQGGSGPGEQATTLGASLIVGGYWGGSPKTSATGPAPAADARPGSRLGDRGQWVLTNELAAQVASSSYAGTPSNGSSGQLALGFDYFFVDHVSLGVSLDAGFSNSTAVASNGGTFGASQTSYGAEARLGVQIPIAGALSLYPRANLGFNAGSDTETSATGQNSPSFTQVYFVGFVPFIVEIAPHFFAGLGPRIARDLSNNLSYPQGQVSNPGTTYGLGFILGGWL